MEYLIWIFFGLSPSIIWLLFFLMKDSHPESNAMVLKIFFYGMVIAIVAAIVEILIFKYTNYRSSTASLIAVILYNIFAIALVEEFSKYFVVRQKVLQHPEFDEPVDAMLYMIISALGFAALENILVLLPFRAFLFETMSLSVFRFVGATFLHALVSGTIGYFLAMSLLKPQRRIQLLGSGLAVSTLLHSAYNFSIIRLEDNNYLAYVPIAILIGLAIFVSFAFRELKKIASVCKIPKKHA